MSVGFWGGPPTRRPCFYGIDMSTLEELIASSHTVEEIRDFIGAGGEEPIRRWREACGVVPTYKLVDTCAAEFEAFTPYDYSTYEQAQKIIA